MEQLFGWIVLVRGHCFCVVTSDCLSSGNAARVPGAAAVLCCPVLYPRSCSAAQLLRHRGVLYPPGHCHFHCDCDCHCCQRSSQAAVLPFPAWGKYLPVPAGVLPPSIASLINREQKTFVEERDVKPLNLDIYSIIMYFWWWNQVKESRSQLVCLLSCNPLLQI